MRKATPMLYLLLICALLLSLSSCKNNLTGPTDHSFPLTYIKGRVDKWSLGDSMTVVANLQYSTASHETLEFVWGSGRVDNEGNFVFALLNPPAQALKSRSVFGTTDSVNSVSVTALGIRYPTGRYFSWPIFNATWDFSSQPTGIHVGDYLSYFEYVDRDLDEVGSFIWPFSGGGQMIYDLHYKKGWNRVIMKDLESKALQLSVSNINDGNWYIASAVVRR